MELYTTPISPNGKRVRIAAAELGIPLELKNLDFAAGENQRPDYLALNPMGKIPTLVDRDFMLWESAAAMCYLARCKGGAVYPEEPRAEAETLRWLFFCSCHIDPYFTTLVVERLIKPRRGGAEDGAQTKAAEDWLARFVPVIERRLAGASYVAGAFTLADIALGCTLELAPVLRYDLAPYPNLRAWLERLQARPTWH
ncbi:MAG TPA: glutathione S-transferase family protein [Stellaceae bacterium]|nr:glutathione S-transferase family protein [Stellaceae bacterium]